MDSKLILPDGSEEVMPIFQIGPYLTGVVRNAIKNDPITNAEYIFMKKVVTRFSPDVLFAIVKLGYRIVSPFVKNVQNILLSNGGSLFILAKDYVNGKTFDVDNLKDEDGFRVPTDEAINYDSELNKEASYLEGIVDEDGYVDSTFLIPYAFEGDIARNQEFLADLLLMNEMLFSEAIYKDVIKNRKHKKSLDYITARPNCIAIKKDGDKFDLSYVSENNGKVKEFIDRLQSEDKIAKYDLLEVPSTNMVVQEANDLKIVEEENRSLLAK